MTKPAGENPSLTNLPLCPESPNCVSSQSSDPEHFVDPLVYRATLEEAKARLQQVLTSLPRTQIVEEQPTSIRAESTSLIFRFTDDLDFAFDDKQKLIHVRSASRVGYSDLGANRKRVEMIRQRFQSQN